MIFLVLGISAFAQKLGVEGTVSTTQGESLPGASVVVKGTTTGVLTDFDGHYSISAQQNDVLVFSFVGYETKEVTMAGQTLINVSLSESAQQLDDVIVTALGIEKKKSTIGYAVSEVEGDDLVKAREPNAINSLVGKVAGLVVGGSPELLGAPSVSLRGLAPLYVIDGVPVLTDSWNLSPDDIESYTVLKGPSAGALYGSRGMNGVIQITTKRGKKTGKKDFTVDFNSSTMFEKGFLAIPKVQDEYGPGDHGKYSFGDGRGGGLNDGDYDIWGPKFDGQLIAQYDSPIDPETGERIPTPWIARGKDNLERFIETGLLSTNNLAVSTANEKYDLRFSASHTYQKGIVPNTSLNMTGFNLSAGYNISKKLRLEANMAYSRQYTPNTPDVSYGPNSIIYNITTWGGADWDIDDMRDYWQPGKEGVQSKYAEYQRYHNPYFMSYEWLRGHYKTDVYGYLMANYKINNYLNLMARTAITSYDLFRNEKLPFSAHPYGREAGLGDYREDKRSLFDNNTDVLLTFDKYVIPKLNVHAYAGGNLRTYSFRSSYASTNYMNVPGWYNLRNSKDPVKSYSLYAPMMVLSGYAMADFTYDDFATLSFTGRWDKNSTLPVANSVYFYPSVSSSIELSKLFTIPKVNSFKVRGSWSNVGGALTRSSITSTDVEQGSSVTGYGGNYYSPYDGPTFENTPAYSISLIQGLPGASYTGTITNPELKPSFNSAWDAGTDIGLFDNRLTFGFTYFSSIEGPSIFSLGISEASGYGYKLVNGKKYQRKGVEMEATAVPVYSGGFKWEVSANYTSFREYLKEIYQGVDKLGEFLKVGDRSDIITGSDFIRTPDGQLINDGSGRPIRNPKAQILGYSNPDWVGAIRNTFSYKALSFSFQIDGRFGGTILDYVEKKTFQGGRHIETIQGKLGEARLNDIQGIKSYIGDGVYVSNDVAIEYDANGNISNYDQLQFAPNATATYAQDYVSRYYGTDNAVNMSRTFIKLREVVLTYTLPKRFLKNTFIDQANISFIGRNLLYFAEKKDIDVEQYTGGNAYSGLQTPSTRRYGVNINLTF
ncbi:MAG: SusC/RagA family TonB-linked outer membrane protein [Bacteroidales bacterium]|nr:SusC/RagA family TonB-linked outer membrane protein [Bacteroidales bacterium]